MAGFARNIRSRFFPNAFGWVDDAADIHVRGVRKNGVDPLSGIPFSDDSISPGLWESSYRDEIEALKDDIFASRAGAAGLLGSVAFYNMVQPSDERSVIEKFLSTGGTALGLGLGLRHRRMNMGNDLLQSQFPVEIPTAALGLATGELANFFIPNEQEQRLLQQAKAYNANYDPMMEVY